VTSRSLFWCTDKCRNNFIQWHTFKECNQQHFIKMIKIKQQLVKYNIAVVWHKCGTRSTQVRSTAISFTTTNSLNSFFFQWWANSGELIPDETKIYFIHCYYIPCHYVLFHQLLNSFTYFTHCFIRTQIHMFWIRLYDLLPSCLRSASRFNILHHVKPYIF